MKCLGSFEVHLQVVTTAWSLSSLRHFNTLQRNVCSIVMNAEARQKGKVKHEDGEETNWKL
jgi:hypothetical protein